MKQGNYQPRLASVVMSLGVAAVLACCLFSAAVLADPSSAGVPDVTPVPDETPPAPGDTSLPPDQTPSSTGDSSPPPSVPELLAPPPAETPPQQADASKSDGSDSPTSAPEISAQAPATPAAAPSPEQMLTPDKDPMTTVSDGDLRPASVEAVINAAILSLDTLGKAVHAAATSCLETLTKAIISEGLPTLGHMGKLTAFAQLAAKGTKFDQDELKNGTKRYKPHLTALPETFDLPPPPTTISSYESVQSWLDQRKSLFEMLPRLNDYFEDPFDSTLVKGAEDACDNNPGGFLDHVAQAVTPDGKCTQYGRYQCYLDPESGIPAVTKYRTTDFLTVVSLIIRDTLLATDLTVNCHALRGSTETQREESLTKAKEKIITIMSNLTRFFNDHMKVLFWQKEFDKIVEAALAPNRGNHELVDDLCVSLRTGFGNINKWNCALWDEAWGSDQQGLSSVECTETSGCSQHGDGVAELRRAAGAGLKSYYIWLAPHMEGPAPPQATAALKNASMTCSKYMASSETWSEKLAKEQPAQDLVGLVSCLGIVVKEIVDRPARGILCLPPDKHNLELNLKDGGISSFDFPDGDTGYKLKWSARCWVQLPAP